jgi:hypothetical protein
MTSELPDDPKRPRRDDEEAVDEDAEEEDEAERRQRDRDERAFHDDLENADEFEPTLDVPLPIADKRPRKVGR